jgi:hypothetical protein
MRSQVERNDIKDLFFAEMPQNRNYGKIAPEQRPNRPINNLRRATPARERPEPCVYGSLAPHRHLELVVKTDDHQWGPAAERGDLPPAAVPRPSLAPGAALQAKESGIAAKYQAAGKLGSAAAGHDTTGPLTTFISAPFGCSWRVIAAANFVLEPNSNAFGDGRSGLS